MGIPIRQRLGHFCPIRLLTFFIDISGYGDVNLQLQSIEPIFMFIAIVVWWTMIKNGLFILFCVSTLIESILFVHV